MIKLGIKPGLLIMLEAFQNRFLGIDSAISRIKQKISVHQAITTQDGYSNKDNLIAARNKKLESEMEQVDRDFKKLTEDFNNFLRENPGIS